MRVDPARGPLVRVEPTAHRPGSSPREWIVTWRIQNLGDRRLALLAAWLPHGRFRAPERAFAPALGLSPRESLDLELPVACGEPPGTEVENAFLILRVLWGDEPWRILTRLRIVFDQQGTPESRPELITTQPIGFSG